MAGDTPAGFDFSGSSLEAPPNESPDEPSWLDATMPAGITHEQMMQAFERLSPADRAFVDVLFRRIVSERNESPSPREFDQESYRLKAAQMAEFLGSTANAVSVRWAKIQRRLRRTVSVLRAQELRAEGHSVPTIRATLRQLGLSGAEVEKVLSRLRLPPEQARGGAT